MAFPSNVLGLVRFYGIFHFFYGTLNILGLGFLEFHQNSATVFGMKEDDGFPMSSNLGLFTQHPDLATLPQALHGLPNVIHFNANVMDSSLTVLVQKLLLRNN